MSAQPETPTAEEAGRAGRPLPARIWGGLRHFGRRSPLSAFWGCVALLIVVMAVAAPVISPYPPLKSDFRSMQKAPYDEHLFGTDQIGRDTLSRVIHGSRTSLIVAFGGGAARHHARLALGPGLRLSGRGGSTS